MAVFLLLSPSLSLNRSVIVHYRTLIGYCVYDSFVQEDISLSVEIILCNSWDDKTVCSVINGFIHFSVISFIRLIDNQSSKVRLSILMRF